MPCATADGASRSSVHTETVPTSVRRLQRSTVARAKSLSPKGGRKKRIDSSVVNAMGTIRSTAPKHRNHKAPSAASNWVGPDSDPPGRRS